MDFDSDSVDALFEGMQRCYKRNPDPGFSVYRLIARISELIVFSHNPKEAALICEERVDDFGNKYLFLWGAYATSVKYDSLKARKTLRWAATNLGCKYIETVSQRAGFFKLLQGMEDVETIPTITYRITM